MVVILQWIGGAFYALVIWVGICAIGAYKLKRDFYKKHEMNTPKQEKKLEEKFLLDMNDKYATRTPIPTSKPRQVEDNDMTGTGPSYLDEWGF